MKTKLKLTIDLVIDHYDEADIKEVKENLWEIPMYLAGNGMFTGISSAEVDSYDYDVVVEEVLE